MMTPQDILDFWFRDIDEALWWRKDDVFAIMDCDIIARFTRFLHRNVILGRVSTEDERAFLKVPGLSL